MHDPEENLKFICIDWTKPAERTNAELALFIRHEPFEHVIGHQYTNGISVITGVYEEIAKRLEEKK